MCLFSKILTIFTDVTQIKYTMTRNQKKYVYAGVVTSILALGFTIPSCVDDRYDLDKLNTEMTLGGDSLTVPLGSTDTIRLGDILDVEDEEMLKTLEDGGYGLQMKDSLSVEVPQIDKSQLTLQNQVFSQSQQISFGDMSLEDFSIPGIGVNSQVSLNVSPISMSGFVIPPINESKNESAGVSGYALSAEDKNIAAAPFIGNTEDVFSSYTLPDGSSYNPPVELPIMDQTSSNTGTSIDAAFQVNVPNGVSNIQRIDLQQGAKLKISIELIGADALLESGTIHPDFNIDLTDLFVLSATPSSSIIKLSSTEALTKANQYKSSKEVSIDAFNIDQDPVNGVISINKAISSNGTLASSGLKAMSNNIHRISGLELKITVELVDIVVESMVFDIPTITTNINGSTDFTIENTIPTDIEKIQKVYFNSPSKIAIRISAQSLPTMVNSNIRIKTLNITFPEEFSLVPVAGLNGNVYTTSNVVFDPAVGKTIELDLVHLDMSSVTVGSAGEFTWSDQISYTAEVDFSGRINSTNIPSNTSDAQIQIDIQSNPTFQSADVRVKNIDKTLDPIQVGLNIQADVADAVKRLNVVQLKEGSRIQLNLTQPTLPLQLSANGIEITFPSIFKFKSSTAYPTLSTQNKLILTGTIPTNIPLNLEALVVNKELTDGRLDLQENILISGAVRLLSGDVNSLEVSDLSDKKLLVAATSNDLLIASTEVLLNTLTSQVVDSTDIQFSYSDIPDQLVSLDSIRFATGAALKLDVLLSNMPQLSNPLEANMYINFPEVLIFEPGYVDAQNRLHIQEAFTEDKLSKTIPIRGLRFNGEALNGNISIDEKVNYDVTVTVEEPSVSSDQLNNDPIQVDLNVTLAQLQFNSIYGKIDPGIEPQVTSIDLDLPEFLEGDDIVLDITKPVITLESTSNLGIPLDLTIELIPSKNGVIRVADKQTIQLHLPKADNETSLKTGFWISPDSAGMPLDYRFVSADIQNLFRLLPDKIDFKVVAGASANQQHTVDLNTLYAMDVAYNVTIPFTFGKDLVISMRDTIADLNESIGKMALKGNKLELLGKIYNSIPLQLDLELIPFDENNNPIAGVEPGRQTIYPGTRDGEATTTTLNLTLDDPEGRLIDLRGFELFFRASSNETVAGAPLKPENFVKAELRARLNGGIKIGGE